VPVRIQWERQGGNRYQKEDLSYKASTSPRSGSDSSGLPLLYDVSLGTSAVEGKGSALEKECYASYMDVQA
jgi:hypothetical protein